MKPLYIYYEKMHVGTFIADDAFRLDFTYDEHWLKHPEAFPLSISLPLQKGTHSHPRPTNFLENLLPEQKIRRVMELAHGLPQDNPYQFLKEFGQDVAGAFVISVQPNPSSSKGRMIELSLASIQNAIEEGRQLYQSITDDYGAKFSLAGAQDKFCIIYKNEKIFVGLDGEPSTHIAKVNLDFRNSQTVFNEYFCMKLAEKSGLPVPRVTLITNPALLLVERYDRMIQEAGIKRLHQEDFCQAQGISSGAKYEDRDGPGFVRAYELIRKNSKQPIRDLEYLLDWMAFNLIIGNNDSHSKNISFLYQGKSIRLAPFYDLLSTAVYKGRFSPDFAFKIGSTMRYEKIRRSDILTMEKSLGVREGKFLKNLVRMSKEIQIHVDNISAHLSALAPEATIGKRIEEEIRQRLKHFKEHGHILP